MVDSWHWLAISLRIWRDLDTTITIAQTLPPNYVKSVKWWNTYAGYFGLIFVHKDGWHISTSSRCSVYGADSESWPEQGELHWSREQQLLQMYGNDLVNSDTDLNMTH